MEFLGKKAIYLQIADFVCEQILLKKWQENAKIPSIRDLAILLEVNPNTVTRTYAYLEENAIITMQRGIGYFVADKAYTNALELKRQEFLNSDLPQMFRSMDLLNISLKEFKQFFDQRRKS